MPLILLAVYEIKFGSGIDSTAFGGLFLFSRLLHIIGLQYLQTPKVFGVAMVTQHSYFVVAAGMLIYGIAFK